MLELKTQQYVQIMTGTRDTASGQTRRGGKGLESSEKKTGGGRRDTGIWGWGSVTYWSQTDRDREREEGTGRQETSGEQSGLNFIQYRSRGREENPDVNTQEVFRSSGGRGRGHGKRTPKREDKGASQKSCGAALFKIVNRSQTGGVKAGCSSTVL